MSTTLLYLVSGRHEGKLTSGQRRSGHQGHWAIIYSYGMLNCKSMIDGAPYKRVSHSISETLFHQSSQIPYPVMMV